MSGEIGIAADAQLSDDFATIPDVPILPDSNRVNPNQVASGITRGAQTVLGADGKPQVLSGNQRTFGNGLYVARAGIDVITNTDPANFIFNSNQNLFKIVTVLSGASYTHSLTTAEITARFGQFSFAHNLGYRPKIDASFTNSSDGLTRQMPFTFKGPQTYFGASGGGAIVEIQSIDNTNINCAYYIFDASGLSWLLSAGILSFKFYCQQETLI